MKWVRADRAEMPGFTGGDFKVCELCGALNVASSSECVICGWHGRFDYDPEAVEKAMENVRAASGDDFFSEDVTLEEYLGEARRRPHGPFAWLRHVLRLDRDVSV